MIIENIIEAVIVAVISAVVTLIIALRVTRKTRIENSDAIQDMALRQLESYKNDFERLQNKLTEERRERLLIDDLLFQTRKRVTELEINIDTLKLLYRGAWALYNQVMELENKPRYTPPSVEEFVKLTGDE